MNVFTEIKMLGNIALSEHEHAIDKTQAIEHLTQIRDMINEIITPTCVRCGRRLIVPQHLDHVELSEGIICIPCVGGS